MQRAHTRGQAIKLRGLGTVGQESLGMVGWSDGMCCAAAGGTAVEGGGCLLRQGGRPCWSRAAWGLRAGCGLVQGCWHPAVVSAQGTSVCQVGNGGCCGAAPSRPAGCAPSHQKSVLWSELYVG